MRRGVCICGTGQAPKSDTHPDHVILVSLDPTLREARDMKKKMPQAVVILIAMVAGVILGYMVFVSYPDKKSAAQIAGYIAIFSDVFLRLIKMLIGPLVFSSLGEKAKTMIAVIDELAHTMLKITGYVMKLAPLAVCAAMAATVAVNGLEILLKFAVFMGDFYLGLFVLWGVLILAGFLVLGPRIFQLLKLIKEAFMLSFATASSEAAYPKILDALDRFGVKRKISSFVLPLGYSFNLDGSMMYCTFATLFIAQAYGIQLAIGTQITMLLILMLTSKGMAGVPRASLVVIAATLNQVYIPEAGLLLLLGGRAFLDMGRSATNAIGNSLASAAVAKWEGELLSPHAAKANLATLDTGAEAAPA